MWLDTNELESAREMKLKLDRAEQLLANVYTNLSDMPDEDALTGDNSRVIIRLCNEIYDYLNLSEEA